MKAALKAALIDASSAILIFKAHLLKHMSAAFRLCVVQAVFEEITVAGRAGASEFKAALAAGHLTQVHPRQHPDPSMNALLCPHLLRMAGHIDHAAHAGALETVLRQGRYSQWVIDFANQCLPQDLHRFMPQPGNFSKVV